MQQNLHDCNIGNCNTIDRQLQHNLGNCNTTRNLGEKSKNKSIYSYATYMGMDFLTGAQAGGDEHVHDSRPARGPGKYHTPTPPHPLFVFGAGHMRGGGFRV